MASKRQEARSFRPVEAVEVLAWGDSVGAVALDPKTGHCAFRYQPAFARREIELAPLQMPLSTERIYVFPELPEATYKRLPAMLADALPDAFGNALIDRYMAERGINAAAITPLDRLTYMGRRGMGALTFRPARGPVRQKPTALDMDELVSAARAAVHGSVEDDRQAAQSLQHIVDVGTSAGGARAKAVVALNSQTGEMVSGQLNAPDGFEHWLLKFDGLTTARNLGSPGNFGRIEMAYHLMAKAAGIEMTDCRLLEENGRAHFMTKRFDRHGSTGRHHVQSLCAMAHMDFNLIGVHGYTQLFSTMRALQLPYEQMCEAFRRMAFNVMARNCDDHTKNFSFILRQGTSTWALAPAYDITFAYAPQNKWLSKHLMAVNGKFDGITRDDLLQEAERYGIGHAKHILQEVRNAIDSWPEFARAAQVPQESVASTQRELRPT